MKLQRVLSREVEGTKYHKWQLVLPSEQIEELGWEEGEELEAVTEGGRLVLQPAEETDP